MLLSLIDLISSWLSPKYAEPYFWVNLLLFVVLFVLVSRGFIIYKL